jgi:hypothetical protein
VEDRTVRRETKRLMDIVRRALRGRIPDYVFRECCTSTLDWFSTLARQTWSLEVVEIGLDDFEPTTRSRILERQFGDVPFAYVSRDAERTRLQRELVIGEEPGTNEPVILMSQVDGYELLEGWHRTMVRLPRDGGRTRLRAWVGRDGSKQGTR